jgi:NMD protein affecting ribosome stability and mRNA decay
MTYIEQYWRDKDVAECGGLKCVRCGWGRDEPELELCCDCFDEEWTNLKLPE